MDKSKFKSKTIKAQPTQEKVLTLLVYLLEAKHRVSMLSLEKLYGGGEGVDQDKRRTIFRHLDIIEKKWGIDLIRGDHYEVKKKAAFAVNDLNSMEAQALYFSAQDITDPDMRLMTQSKLLRMYQERRKKEDLFPKKTLELADWCEVHINAAKSRWQMILKNYTSINSVDIKDRLVVPLSFNAENLEVYAYDLQDPKLTIKVFKLDRMDGIVKLKERAPKELNLTKTVLQRDPFGYLLGERVVLTLDLRLDLKAFVLFSLHFSKLVPRIEKISDAAKPYRIELELVKVDPIAGWLLGLINHIEIVDSPAFMDAWKKHYEYHIAPKLKTIFN